MSDSPVLPLPPNAPRVKPNRFVRWVGRSILRVGGWRMVGRFPDIPKLVMIGAPHSSNWDGLWAFGAKMALGLDVHILAKESLFKVPVLGHVLHRLGVLPVNRRAARGVVEQAVDLIRQSEKFWYGIAPEGTRQRVEHWKTGFWKIAHGAGVPVLPVYFHYPDKIIGVGELFHLSGDMEADMARIRAWYRPWIGRNRGTT
ncbi:MAG TPA: acyltransferase [Xanthomonadaceae bacterium]|nr:acyltransferase [Xanthomonadaceae bacterium]